MEFVLVILLFFAISALLYVIRHSSADRERNWTILGPSSSGSSNPPPATKQLTPEQREIVSMVEKDSAYWTSRMKHDASGIMVTHMTKDQLNSFLKNNSTMSEKEAARLSAINPDEVVYIDETHWFDPKQCEVFPSKTLCGDELFMTSKGSWILKTSKDSTISYEIVDTPNAFLFLEQNGYKEMAAIIAPADPRNEV